MSGSTTPTLHELTTSASTYHPGGTPTTRRRCSHTSQLVDIVSSTTDKLTSPRSSHQASNSTAIRSPKRQPSGTSEAHRNGYKSVFLLLAIVYPGEVYRRRNNAPHSSRPSLSKYQSTPSLGARDNTDPSYLTVLSPTRRIPLHLVENEGIPAAGTLAVPRATTDDVRSCSGSSGRGREP